MQDSHQKVAYKRYNPIITGRNFEKNKQNSEKFDSETSKLQPVNLSETSRDTAGVHKRAADSFNTESLPFVTKPAPSTIMTN